MKPVIPPSDIAKAKKLIQLADELRQGKNFSITRLTVLKSLSKDPEVAHRFALYLAQKTMKRLKQGHGRTKRSTQNHKKLMTQALAAMNAWIRKPSNTGCELLRDLQQQMRQEQNEYRRIRWGAVRIIHDSNLLIFEYALECLLCPPTRSGSWAYRLARHYAERYDSRYGTGLIPASAPFMQDIADFWAKAIPGTNKKIAKGRRAKEEHS